MNMSSANEDQAIKSFSILCHRAFMGAMDELRAAGQKQNLSVEAICVAITVAAIHAQALACVGADIPAESFDGLLADDIERTRAGVSAKRKPA